MSRSNYRYIPPEYRGFDNPGKLPTIWPLILMLFILLMFFLSLQGCSKAQGSVKDEKPRTEKTLIDQTEYCRYYRLKVWYGEGGAYFFNTCECDQGYHCTITE